MRGAGRSLRRRLADSAESSELVQGSRQTISWLSLHAFAGPTASTGRGLLQTSATPDLRRYLRCFDLCAVPKGLISEKMVEDPHSKGNGSSRNSACDSCAVGCWLSAKRVFGQAPSHPNRRSLAFAPHRDRPAHQQRRLLTRLLRRHRRGCTGCGINRARTAAAPGHKLHGEYKHCFPAC